MSRSYPDPLSFPPSSTSAVPASASSSTQPASSAAHSTTTFYRVKWTLNAATQSLPIIMQGRNGPCPLLALANATLLRGEISIPPGTTRISEPELMAILAEFVSSRSFPANPTAAAAASSSAASSSTDPFGETAAAAGAADAAAMREVAVTDFLDLLPRLNTGMNVNPRFGGPLEFEFTRELSAFDVFPNLRLVHGWLVDPQDPRLFVALGSLSYNQLIDELVRTDPLASSSHHLADQIDAGGADSAATAPPPEAFAELDPSWSFDQDDTRDSSLLTTTTVTNTNSAAAHNPPPPHFDPNDISEVVQLSPRSSAPATSFPSLQPQQQRIDSHRSSTYDETDEVQQAESSVTANIRELRPAVVDFLESNPTQMTIYGLAELHTVMRPDETAILFRNSHFYVVRKHDGELYTLVTDEGFLDQLNTVWEKLVDVTGDSVFYSGAFQRIAANGRVVGASNITGPGARPGGNTRPAQAVPPSSAASAGALGVGTRANGASSAASGRTGPNIWDNSAASQRQRQQQQQKAKKKSGKCTIQ